MSPERLQKVLAQAGVASRRGAEELIREGRVTVNGAVAELGMRVSPLEDAIKVDGKRLRPRTPTLYLVLNKPDGYLSARSDPRGRPTVMDLIPAGYRKVIFPVGRLDFHTEGLLVLTDDGEFAQRVSHPRHGCIKRYAVKVKGVPQDAVVERLRRGIVIDGKRTAPAKIRLLRAANEKAGVKNSWWSVELAEGRTRQIREMFFRAGHPVQRLRRMAIGPVSDRGLARGQWRELTPAEVAALSGKRRPQGRRR